MANQDVQRDGWVTVQECCLIANALRNAARVHPAEKQRDADALRAAVEAHIRTSGNYERLDAAGGEAR